MQSFEAMVVGAGVIARKAIDSPSQCLENCESLKYFNIVRS
jgi:hypothetical protein